MRQIACQLKASIFACLHARLKAFTDLRSSQGPPEETEEAVQAELVHIIDFYKVIQREEDTTTTLGQMAEFFTLLNEKVNWLSGSSNTSCIWR